MLWMLQENCVPSMHAGKKKMLNSCSLHSSHCHSPYSKQKLKSFSVGYYFMEYRVGKDTHVLVKITT